MDTDASSLGLSERLMRGMANSGLRAPTSFQTEILRLGMEGKNVLALVPPSQEVVAAVVLPALQQCALAGEIRADRSPRALIITSSRDRARTLQRGALSLGKYLSIRAVALYGGVSVESQIPLIQAGAEILIATPDRLLDHLRQGTVSVAGLRILVLDETDRLLEEGSLESFGSITQSLPGSHHTLLFAGRKSEALLAFVGPLLGDAAEVQSGEGESELGLRPSGKHRGHQKPAGRPHPSTKREPRSGPPRHTGPVKRTGGTGHPGAGKHSGSGKHPGPGRPPGVGMQSGTTRHPGGLKHSASGGGVSATGHPKHPHLTPKAKKKPRRTSSAIMTAPRKKRPPKRLDSFSSDSGGAGWSSY